MSKIYKGWELMKALEDGEIKDGSRFYVYRTFNAIAVLENRILHFEDGNERILTTNDLLIYTFELIEDEIYIDSIEELKISENYGCEIINEDNIYLLFKQQNQILQAVKQLDKRIKKLEE